MGVDEISGRPHGTMAGRGTARFLPGRAIDDRVTQTIRPRKLAVNSSSALQPRRRKSLVPSSGSKINTGASTNRSYASKFEGISVGTIPP